MLKITAADSKFVYSVFVCKRLIETGVVNSKIILQFTFCKNIVFVILNSVLLLVQRVPSTFIEND